MLKTLIETISESESRIKKLIKELSITERKYFYDILHNELFNKTYRWKRFNLIASGENPTTLQINKSSLKGTNKIMAQTLVQIFIHVVFSTKNRVDMITPEIETELFAYIGRIAINNNSKLVAANGTANHIHLLILLSKTIELSELIGDIKRNSSRWIKTKGSDFKSFCWQDGFSAFSVGQTQVPMVKEYIANQKEKHGIQKFEEEMRLFYNKYGIEYDERYIWDWEKFVPYRDDQISILSSGFHPTLSNTSLSAICPKHINSVDFMIVPIFPMRSKDIRMRNIFLRCERNYLDARKIFTMRD